MGSRLYTRKGDLGSTGLMDGSRLAKDAFRIEAMGAVDELNALIGLLASYPEARVEAAVLTGVQNALFEIGAELADPASPPVSAKRAEGSTARITPEEVAFLEQAIDRLDAQVPPLERFILPGGTQAGATCHLARTVCRRAERRLFRLARDETVNSASLMYLNRLSDLLFVLARWLVRQGGGEETLWHARST